MQALKERAQQMSYERVDVWIEPNNRPVDAIVTTVKFRPRAMICMSTHARQGVRRAVYGSIAESIIARVDVPVVLLGPHFPGGDGTHIRQLVVCVDDSATSQSALPLAALWAQHLQIPCTLLHLHHRGEKHRRRSVDIDSMRVLLERSSPHVEIIEDTSRDPVGAVLHQCTPSSRAMAVMATHDDLGRGSAGINVMKMVENAKVPVLVERVGAKRPAPAVNA